MVINTINEEMSFCDYYSQWVDVYKEGAIREVTMKKYKLTQAWLRKLIPDLKLSEFDRVSYQKLINGYAEHHEHQTVVPEFLRTLVFARPRGDDQFADCTFSPSLDMSR